MWLSCLIIFQINLVGFAQSGIISTYVGPGLPVDGSLAINQGLDGPTSVALDGRGGFFVSSGSQNRIYHVAVNGQIESVAGNGVADYGGDGGKAISAKLNDPEAVAIDFSGNLYIADTGNHRIRKVTPNGIISTIAGNGTQGFSGDGGPAVSAGLNDPSGVAVGPSGNLYIADSGNHRIRKITLAGIISTVAGDGMKGFSGDGSSATSVHLNYPRNVAVDVAGNLFISDYENNRIRKVTPVGIISTVAGNGSCGRKGDGGPAAAAQLCSPIGIAADVSGNLFIADSGSSRILKVAPDNIIHIAVSGGGVPAASTHLSTPTSVVVDALGDLYIADCRNNRVRRVTPDGAISTVAGNGTSGFSGDNGPASMAIIDTPIGVAVDADGNLFLTDNNRIRKVTPNGIINTVAGNGTSGFSGDGKPAITAELNEPASIAVDAAGNLIIADTSNNRIRKVTPNGIINTIAGNGMPGFSGDGGLAILAQLATPQAVAVDALGNLYIADSRNNRIRKVTPDGIIHTVAGNGMPGFSNDGDSAAASARLWHPTAVAVDAAGNIFTANRNRILKVTNGIISIVAGNGTFGFSGDGGPATSAQLFRPRSIAVDAAGNLYIADSETSQIRKVTPDGTISTVAGNGTSGFSGDGKPAISAQLHEPASMAVDAVGNLFIADSGNHRIRKVSEGKTANNPK
jgi:trimeric autotransporter adhesin